MGCDAYALTPPILDKTGSNFTEPLKQLILLDKFLVLSKMSTIPATNGTCGYVFWLVALLL